MACVVPAEINCYSSTIFCNNIIIYATVRQLYPQYNNFSATAYGTIMFTICRIIFNIRLNWDGELPGQQFSCQTGLVLKFVAHPTPPSPASPHHSPAPTLTPHTCTSIKKRKLEACHASQTSKKTILENHFSFRLFRGFEGWQHCFVYMTACYVLVCLQPLTDWINMTD